MQYRSISNVKVSLLGMGNMRLPRIEGQPESAIDYAKAQ